MENTVTFFGKLPGRLVRGIICLLFPALLVFCQLPCIGATLQKKTIEAYNSYIEQVENKLLERREGKLPFQFVKESPGNLISLEEGQIVLRNMNEDDETPKGIIHDWIGAVELPEVTLDEVLNLLTDYDRHAEIFEEILSSSLISQGENRAGIHMRLRKDGLLTVVVDSLHESETIKISSDRAQILCHSVRINEVEDPGTEDEKILPEGNDRGILWRLNSYISLEESAQGVVVECRSINLSRGLPFGISLILGPFLKNLPPESIESMLNSLRQHFTNQHSG